LVAQGGDVTGFVIAGADKQWVKANGRIDGSTVVLSHPDVKEPVAARYGWAWNPDGNLFNGAGLPASPFRTDDPGASKQ
jgi:sialate O-acetylesterase